MMEQLNEEFINVYLETLGKKLEDYMRTQVLLESKLIIAENKNNDLASQIEDLKKKLTDM
jgi:hypothetical protein